MISTEYDEELALSLARKNARAEGIVEGKIEMIKKMLTQKFPIDTIALISEWSEEDILKVANRTFPVK